MSDKFLSKMYLDWFSLGRMVPYFSRLDLVRSHPGWAIEHGQSVAPCLAQEYVAIFVIGQAFASRLFEWGIRCTQHTQDTIVKLWLSCSL